MTRLLALSTLFLSACFSTGSAEVAATYADGLHADAQGHFVVTMGEVTVDDPVDGPLFSMADARAFSAVVEGNAGYLQRCYEERLREVPDLAGSVVIHTHITPEGRAGGQCLTEDTVGDQLLRDCVNETLARGPYPTGHRATVDVAVPFVFTPPAKG
jgi:hypothetical protein